MSFLKVEIQCCVNKSVYFVILTKIYSCSLVRYDLVEKNEEYESKLIIMSLQFGHYRT